MGMENIIAENFEIPNPYQANINISLPENEAYTININSFNSKRIKNFVSTTVEGIRNGVDYKHNGVRVKINLQTHTGDIILNTKKV